MVLTSPSFEPGTSIPKKFTCDGGDINPELTIHNVPAGTESLALIMEDPDAPDGIYTHWVVWNIGPKTECIKQESRPPGASEGVNSNGANGYIGPCPPQGQHRYIFRLFALDTVLDLPETATAETLREAIAERIKEQCELTGLYAR